MAQQDKRSVTLYRCGRRPRALPEPLQLAVLGATGSIGRQTLDLIVRFPDKFQVTAVAIRSSIDRLIDWLDRLASRCPDNPRPWIAVFEEPARRRAAELSQCRDRLLASGDAGLCEAVSLPGLDCVVNGMVGAVGLAPTLAAARRGLRLALANKESLVVGGGLVQVAVEEGDAEILPVDSEHSAIAQCLSGRAPEEMERIVLTASGGPFRQMTASQLSRVTLEEVLRHPTWDMGPKITVDSATLMNKGLEVIEAHYLFGMPYADIEVVIHPGSVVHSLVVFRDGAVMAQLGAADMRIPLLYAMCGEKHWPLRTERLDLTRTGTLHFEAPDPERFPCLRLARQAAEAGGLAPIVLNAANEVAVAGLLDGRLTFMEVPAVIERALAAIPNGPVGSLEDALAADRETRRIATALSTPRDRR